jgi:NADH dehydrogenase [ubiquinone] 1 alpha subcomplex assembly factor 6
MTNSGSAPTGLPSLLRRHDRDRFLASLLAPADKRPALWALLGFNYEIARVREIVSQPILGQIRLQWWRDTVAEIYENKSVRRHEVATPLAEAVQGHGISRTLLDRMIDARERDLIDEPPATLEALESFLGDTAGALLQAQAEVLSGADGGEAATHVGIAWGLVGLMRSVPFHAAAGVRYVPTDLAEAAGLTEQMLFTARPSPALGATLQSLAEIAQRHLSAARARHPSARIRPALLTARLADVYLKRLKAAGYDPYRPEVQLPDPLAAWRMAWGRLIGRF